MRRALLLCRDGKVVDQLVGVDRSFTTEGVAYEHGRRLKISETLRYPPSRAAINSSLLIAARGLHAP